MLPGASSLALGGPDGTSLGKYQLVRRLATGGMAELFLARASAMHGFEKLCVLKRILPQHAESEEFIRMFLAEARLAATLHHPNIVQVYDIGEDTGTYFFTMEYVQGQDLRKLVRAARRKQRPIPLEHILHIIMGVAAGLHHAHQKDGADGLPLGIVHRDVSPSNVLVTYEGDVKIVDFGIAKAASAQVATVAGTLKGKIPYMSPEQCRGEAVDRRSDIFSIGTLLWELTTGKRLFAGDNEFAILNRVAAGDVPLPSAIRPDYPHELEAIAMRALQALPDQRYANAVDLQLDLEDFAREARLPVSSARMAKFMRDLFDEEIEAARSEVQEHAAMSGANAATVMLISPPGLQVAGEPSLASADYTPSELRSHSSPTPTPELSRDASLSGTDAGAMLHDTVPRRVGLVPVLGLVFGLAITLAIGSLAAWRYGLLSETTTQPPTSARPRVEVVATPQPAEPGRAPSGASAGDPLRTSAGASVRAPARRHVQRLERAGFAVPPLPDPESVLDAVEIQEEDDDGAVSGDDDKTGAKSQGSRKSRRSRRRAPSSSRSSKSSSKKKTTKPDKAPTPWDHDAALPPGL